MTMTTTETSRRSPMDVEPMIITQCHDRIRQGVGSMKGCCARSQAGDRTPGHHCPTSDWRWSRTGLDTWPRRETTNASATSRSTDILRRSR